MGKKKVETIVTVRLTFVEVGDERDLQVSDANTKEQLDWLAEDLIDMYGANRAVVLDAQVLVTDFNTEEIDSETD